MILSIQNTYWTKLKLQKNNTMNKKYIFLLILSLSYNLVFSQKFFTYKTPGYLGQKFYITGGTGYSPANYAPFLADAEFTNAVSFYGGINYTLGRKTDIGAKLVYDLINYSGLTGNAMTIQARILSSNHIAPIGTRWGLGLHYGISNYSDGNNSRSISNVGGGLIIERNYPISNKFLLTYGAEFVISVPLEKVDISHEVNANIARFNFGICYMIF